MNEKGSNHRLLKKSNYHLIMRYIYQHSPISRVEVARELNLTTPTITGMVTPLIQKGLLRESAPPEPEAAPFSTPRARAVPGRKNSLASALRRKRT